MTTKAQRKSIYRNWLKKQAVKEANGRKKIGPMVGIIMKGPDMDYQTQLKVCRRDYRVVLHKGFATLHQKIKEA